MISSRQTHKPYLHIALYAFKSNIFENLCADMLLRFQWQNEGKWFLLFLGPVFHSISSWRSSREQINNKDKIWKAFQWNISLVANLERQNLVFKTLHISRKYIKMIFKSIWLLSHLHIDKPNLWQLKVPISARYWSLLTTIIYERSYEWSKGHTYHYWEKHLIYVLTPEKEIIKKISVIIK